MAKTTTDLLNNIKRRAQLPDDGGTLSDTDLLALASDELQNVIAPKLMSTNEWHYAFSYTQTVTSSRTYRINPRTAGNSIISVEYYDGVDYRFIRLKHPLLQREDLGENYAIYGNQITLSDACPTSGTLRVRAMLRPSSLISTGPTAVSAGVSATRTITVVSTTGFTSGQLVDLVYGSSPYEVLATGRYAAIADATHFTLDSLSADEVSAIASLTDTLLGSDAVRVCPADQSDRIQLPDELHDYLAQRTAIRCMEARGFTQDMQNHLRKLADLEASFGRLMQPRSKGEFKAIVSEDLLFVGKV